VTPRWHGAGHAPLMLVMSMPACSSTHLRCSQRGWSAASHGSQQRGRWHTCSSLCCMAAPSPHTAQSINLGDQLGLDHGMNSQKYDRCDMSSCPLRVTTVGDLRCRRPSVLQLVPESLGFTRTHPVESSVLQCRTLSYDCRTTSRVPGTPAGAFAFAPPVSAATTGPRPDRRSARRPVRPPHARPPHLASTG